MIASLAWHKKVKRSLEVGFNNTVFVGNYQQWVKVGLSWLHTYVMDPHFPFYLCMDNMLSLKVCSRFWETVAARLQKSFVVSSHAFLGLPLPETHLAKKRRDMYCSTLFLSALLFYWTVSHIINRQIPKMDRGAVKILKKNPISGTNAVGSWAVHVAATSAHFIEI